MQKRAQVERELSKLQTELHRIQSNPQKVRRWKQILSRVHAAGLDADNWLLYPLDIDQKLSWAQVEGLVYLVSRGRPYPQDYWFKPELFVLIKIAASKQKANDQHLRAQVTDSEKDMYQIKLKGQFLMRKRMFQ
ncbi:hypothetical protein KFV02_09405 [Desulfohalobiaceae bacterium Ax17]|uniref:hypothetical protein n=1 Tax=Desulfovulcanus ferrireducens TaxID=2831190 RepID=UPI00207BCE17|nr:hypothetical protein [Desulfovulcanus ferrireducens]MBT8764147.1 hypothetical protein [Desulfovulcanus ferrireducens]